MPLLPAQAKFIEPLVREVRPRGDG